jgi:hypothetical protein
MKKGAIIKILNTITDTSKRISQKYLNPENNPKSMIVTIAINSTKARSFK